MKHLIATLALVGLTACGGASHMASDCQQNVQGAKIRKITTPKPNGDVEVKCSAAAADGTALATQDVSWSPSDPEYRYAYCKLSFVSPNTGQGVLVSLSGYVANAWDGEGRVFAETAVLDCGTQ